MSLLIAIEGPDGVGTTTQARLLVERLREGGQPAHLTREPSDGVWGKLVRETLSGDTPDEAGWRSLALGFAADRVDHRAHEIGDKLAAGEVVVTDRYLASSLVYQTLHVPTLWVEEINKFAEPADLVILLELPVDEALARIAKRKGNEEIYDDRDLQVRVHKAYSDLADRRGNIVRVDASGDQETVQARVRALVDERLAQ
jgi:dTMP kinase